MKTEDKKASKAAARRKLRQVIEQIKRRPLEFTDGFTAEGVRSLNRVVETFPVIKKN